MVARHVLAMIFEPKFAPSTLNWTDARPGASASACSVTSPETFAPFNGDEIARLGNIPSAYTVGSAANHPNPRPSARPPIVRAAETGKRMTPERARRIPAGCQL
jgi:hypothetical protein